VKSTGAKRPEDVVFYLDESIYSRRLLEDLTAAKVNLRRAGADVPFGTPDEDWLKIAGINGWVVIMRDQNVRRRELELRALMDFKVGAFIFTAGQASAEDTSATIGRNIKRFANTAISERKPFIFTFGISGTPTRVRLKPSR
jgi:hypothetical protein